MSIHSNEFISKLNKLIVNLPTEITSLTINIKVNSIVTIDATFYATDDSGCFIIKDDSIKENQMKYKLVEFELGD